MLRNVFVTRLIQLHIRFPLERPELLRKWLIALRRKDWTPSKSERICEKHFLPTDYTYPPSLPFSQSLYRKRLKPDAVPSCFNFPRHLQKAPVKERPIPTRSRPVPSEHPCPADTAKVARLEHNYASKESPSKKAIRYKRLLLKKQRIIKTLRQRNIRKEKTIKGLVRQLQKSKLISEEAGNSFGNNFGHMSMELFKNQQKNAEKQAGSRYSEEIKQFAISLHFYSPRAYKFVRKSLSLPHPSTLRAWSSNIECDPGFLNNSLLYVESQVKENQQDCIIIIDEMAIKKQLQWEKKSSTFVGHTDYGSIKGEEPDTIASNALVLMVSGLKKPWYVPLAYFLTDKLNSDILHQLIIESIKMLCEVGAEVHAIVFDGAPKNITVADKLGCNIKRLDGSFPNPCQPGKKIYVILDICHMLKLARNAFGDIKVFCLPSGNKISWEYVLALHRIQQKDVLHLGNKLTAKHVKWQNLKMKVSVAAQTLSHSVSSAITFLRNLNLPEFKDSRPTSDFILLMNDIFDILNSKSKFGKGTKAPITAENLLDKEACLRHGIETLQSLKDTAGMPLIKGQRKLFIVGFSVSALSILAISKLLLERSDLPYEYILTYRFSQDQLEMYFAKIRSRFGWNNNPTALQFKYALRALFQKNKIESPSTANCINVTESEIRNEVPKVDSNVSQLLVSSNIWKADVLHYISGYIAKKILKSLQCPECASALYENVESSFNQTTIMHVSLLSCKKFGNLLVPSTSTYKVVKVTDSVVRAELCIWQNLCNETNVKITAKVLQKTRNGTFESINQHSKETHMLDGQFRDCHKTTLIKLIVKNYLILFYHQFSKIFTERIIKKDKTSKRHRLTKQILFYHD